MVINREHKKRIWEIAFFLVVMCLSFYSVFHGRDLLKIWASIKKMSVSCLFASVVTAIFFVSAEGCMIYYLLRSLDGKSGLLRCISYSFIGFFYSGITPSATGGQPMQLYYMKKDGNDLADSSVVLMVVALIYKFVLVLIGVSMLLFWYRPLRSYLGNYFPLYVLGLLLNVVLVVLLLLVMLLPDAMKGLLQRAEAVAVRLHILKPSAEGGGRTAQFVESYRHAVQFLCNHKGKIVVVTGITFLQRVSVFVLTYIIYRGLGLQGTDMVTVILLQASVYIAVDMLPIPGAQGITEQMYLAVFQIVFHSEYLMPSLYMTRGISFYFLLVCSIVVVLGNRMVRKRRG